MYYNTPGLNTWKQIAKSVGLGRNNKIRILWTHELDPNSWGMGEVGIYVIWLGSCESAYHLYTLIMTSPFASFAGPSL